MIELTNLQKILHQKHPTGYIPLWFMRQAGRYLPEYREIRKKAGDFNTLCYNTDYACEITLQPLKRFHLDAAIIFSDILVIPNALGQQLSVTENIGVTLQPIINNKENIQKLISYKESDFDIFLQPVYQAIKKVRDLLPSDKSLFGFCGAPFTVASYMIAGGTDKEGIKTREFYYQDTKSFFQLIDVLCFYSIRHLCRQIKAGADVIQIFESSAGSISSNLMKECSIDPIQKICDGVKKHYPHIPIILFARGANSYFNQYIDACNINALSIDTHTDIATMAKTLPLDIVLQGNLDPVLLTTGEHKIFDSIQYILDSCKDRALIFNLGHGVLKQTDPKNIQYAIQCVRDWSVKNL